MAGALCTEWRWLEPVLYRDMRRQDGAKENSWDKSSVLKWLLRPTVGVIVYRSREAIKMCRNIERSELWHSNRPVWPSRGEEPILKKKISFDCIS